MREKVVKKRLYEFAEKVRTELEVYYGSGYEIELRDILKNNDSEKCGLIIKEKKINIAPTIYLESYYEMFQSGKELVDVCTEIIKYYEQTRLSENIDINKVICFEEMKEHICFKVVNAKWNRELLKQLPHILIHDLAIVFYIDLRIGTDLNSGITVGCGLQDKWGVETIKLLEYALKNTERIHSLEIYEMDEGYSCSWMETDRVKELLEEIKSTANMYVLTNSKNIYGAAVMYYPNLLKDFTKITEVNRVYIVPVSVHSVVLVAEELEVDINLLKKLLAEVNSNGISMEEKLSENIYIYDCKTDRMNIV